MKQIDDNNVKQTLEVLSELDFHLYILCGWNI